MPLQPDSLLRDRYRIIAELGHGGMGAVYKAFDENLGVEVAIKENLFVSPEAERQFKREASLLASLRHPHLPRVTDHFVIPKEGQYLVMDFVPGEDAKAILERQNGPLPEGQVIRWAREILDALYYLHTRPQPVIHRDIKPGHIKITPDGRAVLVDFGLAKVHDTSSTSTTTVGAKALTPGFAPPEQYGMGRTDSRTDIYALGATLYALLTNQLPADSLEQAIGQKKLIPIRELNPQVSPAVAAAIERALALKPEDRFESAFDFASALAEASRPIAVPPPPITREPETIPRVEAAPPAGPTLPVSRRGHRWVIPAVVLLLILGIGGGVGWVVTNGFQFLAPAATTTATSAPSPLPLATDTVAPTVAPATETSAPTFTASPEPPSATPLPTDVPTITPTFTPASTPRGGGLGQIAFVSNRAGQPQIFIMNADGSDQKQLTNQPDGACQPEWSPDGQQVLFVTPCDRKMDEYPRAALYVIKSDGSNVQPCLTQIGGLFDASWSVSGIAYTYLENNQPRIYVASGCGSGTQISQQRSDDRQPSWSPDGERMVFLNTSRAGVPTLYWMFKDGKFAASNPNQVTRDIDVKDPAWQRGVGSYVVFTSRNQIWLVQWDKAGFGVTQLTNRGPNDDPNWAPDGQWITFESWRDAANHDIYIMTVGGGLQTRLTDDPAQDYQPVWRP
jgi:eukaryotic-like serine/threonine-protein kinase